MHKDRYAKVPFSWNLFKREDKSLYDFYHSYEKEFVKQTSQATIDRGLEDWVDVKMNKLGYVKYKDYFYIKGEKKYYDELPQCCGHK